jgi:hypothetical protein
MNHQINCFVVIFAEVDYPSLRFAKGIAASSIKKAGPRADDGPMHLVFLFAADNGEIRVFANFKKTAVGIRVANN